MRAKRTSKHIHRLTAIFLGLFILSHLIVHLFALGGIEAHLKALDAVQWTYRHPIGEAVLVIAILTQIVTGVKRLKAKRKSPDIWAKAQVYSGLYLIMFLIVHTGAALFTHHIFGLETDFYWAAGSMGISPVKFVFWPYYFAAIMAVFVHFACAVHFGFRGRMGWLEKLLPVLGVITALAIILPISGAFYEIVIPDGVMDYYQKYFPGVG